MQRYVIHALTQSANYVLNKSLWQPKKYEFELWICIGDLYEIKINLIII